MKKKTTDKYKLWVTFDDKGGFLKMTTEEMIKYQDNFKGHIGRMGLNSIVGKYRKGKVMVSTILVTCLDMFKNRPVFETMIFGSKKYKDYQERCYTLDEAVENHYQAVKLVQKKK